LRQGCRLRPRPLRIRHGGLHVPEARHAPVHMITAQNAYRSHSGGAFRWVRRVNRTQTPTLWGGRADPGSLRSRRSTRPQQAYLAPTLTRSVVS
jgi:hypothetical protein